MCLQKNYYIFKKSDMMNTLEAANLFLEYFYAIDTSHVLTLLLYFRHPITVPCKPSSMLTQKE